jgi:hypothetical protein
MLAAAKRKDWNSAYLNANGLSMTEMLSGFAELSPALLLELKAAAATFRGGIDMPRVQYAMQVVEKRVLPTVAPGDLARTGQVDVARKFLLSSPSAAPSGGLADIIRALDEKRLRTPMNNVSGQLRSLASSGSWTDPHGNVLRASPGLITLIAGLVSRNTMTVMSLFRFRGGPHGVLQSDGSAIGFAIDIMAYQEYEINLKTPANANTAINGVAAVIKNLPRGRYQIGLPRPGGHSLIDPAHDVFFKVTNHSQVDHSPGGLLVKDLELLLEPARTTIKSAVSASAGQIGFMFPDGVDHVHVKSVD